MAPKQTSLPAPEDHRRVTQEDAEVIAEHLVDKLVARLSDEETVQAIATVWGKQLDQHIGRTVRRGAYTLFVAFAIFLGLKMEAILAWFKSS